MIEPAFYSKPIIVGPLMANFANIVEFFKADNALVQVLDADGLQQAAEDLMSNQAKRTDLGVRARAVIIKNQGAGTRALKLIEQCL